MPEIALSVDGLSASLSKKKPVLKDVSLEVERGQTVAVLGSSGCGKTTLLRVIAGFVRPSRGTVSILGSMINKEPPERRSVSMLFQDPALFEDLSVTENALLAGRKDRGTQRTHVLELAKKFRLEEHLNEKVRNLSGGERQRAALIRALVNARNVVLFDEPIKSAFNLDLRWEVMATVKEYLQREGLTALIVTHDFEEAAYLASHVTVLVEGRSSALRSPEEMYLSPPNQQIARLLGPVNEVSADLFLDPARREDKCPVRILGGDLRQVDGAQVVLFRPSKLHLSKPGNSFVVKEILPLGELSRVRIHPLRGVSPVVLEASVSPEKGLLVGDLVNAEVSKAAVSIYNAMGERLNVEY